MGNQHEAVKSYASPNRQTTKLSKILKSTCKKIYSGRTKNSGKKRVIFVSLIGAFNCWENIPSETLHNSLFLVPLKQEWLYQPFKYMNELRSVFVSKLTMFSDIEKTQRFFEMIAWKDSQGLVFWVADYFDMDQQPMYLSEHESFPHHSDINPLIASFWYHLSQKIASLRDTRSRKKYKPLILNTDWWRDKKKFVSKFDVKSPAILCELYFLTMKYRNVQEIITQSNPTLNAVIMYGNDINHPMRVTSDKCICHLYDDDEQHDDGQTSSVETDIAEESIWFISDDYDPNDS